MSSVSLLLFFLLQAVAAQAQQVSDALVAKAIKQFIGMGYTHELTLLPAGTKPGVIPNQPLACYTGKEVLVAALYSRKPLKAFARMVVQKKYGGKISFDKHTFQPVAYDKNLKVYYSLISVLFPPEATFKNCHANVQVYDERQQARKVWLLVFTK